MDKLRYSDPLDFSDLSNIPYILDEDYQSTGFGTEITGIFLPDPIYYRYRIIREFIRKWIRNLLLRLRHEIDEIDPDHLEELIADVVSSHKEIIYEFLSRGAVNMDNASNVTVLYDPNVLIDIDKLNKQYNNPIICTRKGSLVAYKHTLPDNIYRMILSDLTIKHKEYNGQWKKSIFYTDKNFYLYLPRYYPIHSLVPHDKHLVLVDIGIDGAPFNDPNARSTISYRKGQREAVSFILDSINNKKTDPIIKLRPGFGKTVITIDALCSIKRRTIVLVNLSDLLKQWLDRIAAFTENVTAMNFSSYLQLDQEKSGLKFSATSQRIEPIPDIFVVTIQKLLYMLRQDPKFIFQYIASLNIGTVVFDEVHSLVGPEQFTQIAKLFTAKRYIFLSATPYRQDAFSKIFWYWTGKNFFSSPYDIKPIVYRCITKSSISNRTWVYIRWGKRFNMSRYLKVLSKDEQYINYIVSIIDHIRSKEGNKRKILVLAERIKMLKQLSKIFTDRNIEHGTYYGDNDRDALNYDLVLASYNKCKQAIDAPHLNTLVLASPPSNNQQLEQILGRILRSADPIVFDIIDINSREIETKGEARLKFYNHMDIEVFPLQKYLE